MNENQIRLLRDIISDAGKVVDTPVKDIFTGKYLISVTSAHTGLCTRATRDKERSGAAFKGTGDHIKIWQGEKCCRYRSLSICGQGGPGGSKSMGIGELS